MKTHWQILVVDDEEVMCDSLAAWLREDGYGVDTASSGREAVVKGTLASSESSGGHRTITVENVRFVSADVAIADGRYEITGMASGQDRRMWSTFVIIRGADGWRISAIRNMLPAAPAR